MSCKSCFYYTPEWDRRTNGHCEYALIANESRTHKLSYMFGNGRRTEYVRQKLRENPCVLYKRRVK